VNIIPGVLFLRAGGEVRIFEFYNNKQIKKIEDEGIKAEPKRRKKRIFWYQAQKQPPAKITDYLPRSHPPALGILLNGIRTKTIPPPTPPPTTQEITTPDMLNTRLQPV